MGENPLRRAVLAGYRADEDQARKLLDHDRAEVRAAALGALRRMDRLNERDLEQAGADPAPAVRIRALESGTHLEGFPLGAFLADPDDGVVEAAAFCLGERGTARPEELDRLEDLAGSHDDTLVRESAVAALGAIGAPRSLPTVLAALGDRATVRRRAVIALAAFEGPEVEAALAAALDDRDWQVRQAAEDLVSPQAVSDTDRSDGSSMN